MIARLLVLVLTLVLLGSTGLVNDPSGDHGSQSSQIDRSGVEAAVTPARVRVPDPCRRVTIVRAAVRASAGRLCTIRVFKPPRARAS